MFEGKKNREAIRSLEEAVETVRDGLVKSLTTVASTHSTILGEHREELDNLDKHVARVVQEADERAELLDEIDVAVDEHEEALKELHGCLSAVGHRVDAAHEILASDGKAAIALRKDVSTLSTRLDGVHNATAADAQAIQVLRKDVDTLSTRLDALRDVLIPGISAMKESNDAMLGLLYGVVQSLEDLDARTQPGMKETPAAKAKKFRKYHAGYKGEAK